MRKDSTCMTCLKIEKSLDSLKNAILVSDLRVIENRDKIYQVQFFPHLLALVLVEQLRFCLGANSVGLAVGLAINRAVSTGVEVVIS